MYIYILISRYLIRSIYCVEKYRLEVVDVLEEGELLDSQV